MTANLAVAKAIVAARLHATRGMRVGGTMRTTTMRQPRSGSVGTMARALEGISTVVIAGDGIDGSGAVQVTSRVRDDVVAVCADDRSIPRVPAGVTTPLSERSTSRQVRCWGAHPGLRAAAPAPDPQAQAEAERSFIDHHLEPARLATICPIAGVHPQAVAAGMRQRLVDWSLLRLQPVWIKWHRREERGR